MCLIRDCCYELPGTVVLIGKLRLEVYVAAYY